MPRRRRLLGLGIAMMLTLALEANAGENWPAFRGAGMNGQTDSVLPLNWSADENVRWKVNVAGEGWSCPVVWNNQVILTTAIPLETEPKTEEPQEEPYRRGGNRSGDEPPKTIYRWQIVSFDLNTGNENWRCTVREGRPPLARHTTNTYATETPVTDGSRIYAYFGMIGLYCVDMAGELVWEKDLGNYEMRAGWGTSSSPLLFDGRLFLQVDNEEQSFLVGLDAATGRELWRTDREEASQYSTPIVWQNSQRNEIITGAQKVRSYDPATGKLLWELDMAKGRSSATPLAIGDQLFVGTELRNRGGPDDGGGFLFCVTPGGSGDITPASEENSSEYVSWKVERSGIQMASPVLCQGRIYLFDRRSGILHCLDAKSGETAYRTRVPGSRAFWASPWTDGDRVYALDDDGTTHVIAAGPEFEEVAANPLGEQCWSTPAVVDGKLLVRTASSLFCIADLSRAGK